MLSERLRSIFRKESDPVSYGGQLAGSPISAARSVSAAGLAGRKSQRKDVPSTRQSRGLEQFFFNIRDVVGLSVLDCAGANQDNINFLADLGHRLYRPDLGGNV